MIGTTVDRYEILEELGHGGMSVVYRGMDSSLEREVAVKVLHNHLAKKLENRQRFHREAKAIARLRHPNILEIYDFSSEDADRSYIVMEYVAGENLRQFVARNEHPPPEAAALIAIEICNALEHAHDHGIIHRDLKPENVMVAEDGTLKLMDFGIAHVIDAETMTATGSLMGSPAHMAPELIDGERVDVRADVFALGTVLYWLSTGSLPFQGANAPQVLRKVLAGEYRDPEIVDPKVGKQLGDIIRTCLARDPDDRYDTVVAVRRVLREFVASMEYTDAETELKRYFKAPDAYRDEFEEQVVERLMALARQAQRRSDVPGAIALFNRILAYDPDNDEVQRLLDRLCRRDAFMRRLPWIAASALVIAALGGGWYWLATRPDDGEPNDVATTPTDPEKLPSEALTDISSAIVESTDVAREALDAARLVGDQRAEHVVLWAMEISGDRSDRPLTTTIQPQPVAVTTRVPDAGNDAGTADAGATEPEPPSRYSYRFSVIPAAATFFVDGRKVEPLKAAAGIELEEGRHELTATSRGARSWTRVLNVDGPQKDAMRVVLHWEKGRVQVVSNTGAVVWVGDKMRRIGARGRNATLSFPFGPADSTPSEKEITLRIASTQDMGNPETHNVTVKPGTLSTVNVNFDPVQ